MAVEVPYTRDHVYAWLLEYKQQSSVGVLRDFLAGKLGDDAQLMVNGQPLIDLLMQDIDSYIVEQDD